MRSVLKASLIWGFAGLVLAVFFFVVGFFTHALDHAQHVAQSLGVKRLCGF